MAHRSEAWGAQGYDQLQVVVVEHMEVVVVEEPPYQSDASLGVK